MGIILFVYMCACVYAGIYTWHVCTLSHSVMSNSLGHHGLQPTRLLCPWDSPGKNSGVGCHALLLGVFLIQGLNLHLLHLPTLASGFFITGATWEAPIYLAIVSNNA